MGLGDPRPDFIRFLAHTGGPGQFSIEYTDGAFPGQLTPAVPALETTDFLVGTQAGRLAPATSYRYRLRVDGAVIPATESSFRTAPDGPAAFSFVAGSCTEFSLHEPEFPRYSFSALRGSPPAIPTSSSISATCGTPTRGGTTSTTSSTRGRRTPWRASCARRARRWARSTSPSCSGTCPSTACRPITSGSTTSAGWTSSTPSAGPRPSAGSSSGSSRATRRACAGDVDRDGAVDTADLLAVLAEWGPCVPDGFCPADLDRSGAVDTADLLAVLAEWGPCPKP